MESLRSRLSALEELQHRERVAADAPMQAASQVSKPCGSPALTFWSRQARDFATAHASWHRAGCLCMQICASTAVFPVLASNMIWWSGLL